MRIEVVRTFYPHWGAHSGINQFLRFMDRERFSIRERLVSDSDQDFPLRNERVRHALRNSIRRRGMQWYKLSDLAAEMKILGRCLQGKVDMVHYLDGEHSAQFLPIILKRLGLRHPRLMSTYHQPPELLASLVRREVLQALDLITVVAPAQASYFKELGLGEKVRLVLHGVNTDHFSPGVPGIPRRCQNVFKCITVGHYLRDFDAVKAVAQRLSHRPEIEFHVVSERAQGLDDQFNVKIHKAIEDSALVTLYREASVFFLPLIQSTANNSLLEGIACGLPVVSTLLPSVKAYVPGDEAMLVRDNEPELLAAAIVDLFENPKKRAAMAESARARAEHLDWRRIALQYEALYSELFRCS